MAISDQEFLEFLIKALVDHPEDVKVNRKVDEMGVLMTLDLNPEDMGKIIGRQGNTAKAIRGLLRVVGMKNNARVNLKINEPEGGTRRFENNTPSTEEATPGAQSTNDSVDQTQSTSDSVDQAMNDLKI